MRRNRYDPNYSPDPDGDNHEVWLDLPPYPAADNPYCSTPRLVLGPDGQHLALARKLKQQAVVTDAKTSTAGATEVCRAKGLCAMTFMHVHLQWVI